MRGIRETGRIQLKRELRAVFCRHNIIGIFDGIHRCTENHSLSDYFSHSDFLCMHAIKDTDDILPKKDGPH